MIRRLLPIVVASVIALWLPEGARGDAPPGGRSCVLNSGGGSFDGSTGILVNGVCQQKTAGSAAASVPTQTILCGRPSRAENALWDKRCGAPKICYDTTTDPDERHPEDAYATLVLNGGRWVLQSVWCPATADPIPTTEALREQALRLLPSVRIGSAWATKALINAQTILWADTNPDRTLTPATVVGRRVQLRISFDHATWTFGDDHSDTTTDPGKVYHHQLDPCTTAQCPGYYGHTYTATGPVTITLQVAWHTQFRLDGTGPWTDIDPQPLTGPTTTHTLTVLQARGVLVPDP